MADQYTTLADLFPYKLAVALQMEHDTLEHLREFQELTQREKLRELFDHHEKETQQQVANLERCFEIWGKPATPQPAPASTGHGQEAHTAIRRTSTELVDGVIMSAALATEHMEIAVYDTLIALAGALGQSEIVTLLQENLDQESHTAEEAKKNAVAVIAESAKSSGS